MPPYHDYRRCVSALFVVSMMLGDRPETVVGTH